MLGNIEHTDELIGKYLAGEASPEEALWLEEWKEQSPENLKHFETCVKIFEISSGNKFPAVDVTGAWDKINPGKKQSESKKADTTVVKMQRKVYWRVAASLAILLGLTAVYFYISGNAAPENIRYEAMAESKTVELKDQSGIVIAPHSQLELDNDFGKKHRTVKLKGSAYFNVKHQDDLPFIVDAGKVYIKDIGTKFDIRTSSDTDTVYVKVDEGIVLLFDSLGTEITLTAMQRAIYVKSTKKIIRAGDGKTPAALRFDFENEKLGDVITRLNQGYHIQISLENTKLASCTITTSFNGQDIETVMTIVTETLGLTYEKNTEGYLIKGQQCNH